MYCHDLQSWTKLLEKVFPIMSTFLRNKTISKTTPLRKEPVQLRCLEKCCPSIQFSQQFCPRLCMFNQAVLSQEEINNYWLLVTSDTGFKGLNPGGG